MRAKNEEHNGMPPHHEAIIRHLSKVGDVDAIYVWLDSATYCRVYSVVEEFDSKIYPKLERRERLVEKEFPDISFDFRVWTHQGRDPAKVDPRGSRLLYVRR